MDRTHLVERLQSICSNVNENHVWETLSTEELTSVILLLEDGGFTTINNMYDAAGQRRPCYTLERVMHYLSVNFNRPIHPVTQEEIPDEILLDIMRAYIAWLRHDRQLHTIDIGIKVFVNTVTSVVRDYYTRHGYDNNNDDDNDPRDSSQIVIDRVRQMLNYTWGALSLNVLVNAIREDTTAPADTGNQTCSIM